jgi:hypothetical protein
MFKYRCERQGCTANEKNIPCLQCANSFYCSVVCRNLDTTHHSNICGLTNTRDMIYINACLVKILHPILIEYSNQRAGIINIRSYSYISCLEDVSKNEYFIETNVCNDNLIIHLRNHEYLENHKFFVTFIPLESYDKNVPTVKNNNYNERIVVNMYLEGMNKPQLFRFPISFPLSFKNF